MRAEDRVDLNVKRVHHAIRRCRERYGIELTPKQYIELVEQIELGSGKYLTTGRVQWKQLWEVRLDEKVLLAVYDESPGMIVTFLPPVGAEAVTYH